MRKIIEIVLLSLLLAGIVGFSLQAYTQARAYEQATQRLVAESDLKAQASYRLHELAHELSLGLIKNKKASKRASLRKERERYNRLARTYTRNAMVLLLLLLGSYFVVSLQHFSLFASLSALVVLAFGLMAPIMMVTIHKEVEYLGDVVLSFESKGVIGSIEKLFATGDRVVAVVILLFSVLIPTIKSLSLLLISLFLHNRFAHGLVKFFKLIGKWSMVDVFVVAVFLVYLTSNKGDVSHAEVEVGLYFFLAYVIVSMLVSLSVDRLLHQTQGR